MKKVFIVFILIVSLLLLNTQNLIYASSHTAGDVISDAEEMETNGPWN